ncbi:hypothetical protein SAMN05216255_3516 [Pseudomonas segetis]|uniref:Uncharacterized protein n=1 Tax=Pseudomonas segetis TaxID=298908 RepID=A0A239HQB9_9PSED|nr:hypothetical protein SAMN05216255_3516 [Pseudomonas segetis]
MHSSATSSAEVQLDRHRRLLDQALQAASPSEAANASSGSAPAKPVSVQQSDALVIPCFGAAQSRRHFWIRECSDAVLQH